MTETRHNPFDEIITRLDAQDAMLGGIRSDHEQLMARWSESAVDRAAIRARLDAMDQERARLVQQAQIYRDATEVRMQAVESRDAITEVRTTVGELRTAVAEVQAAAAVLIAVHRWWHKRGNRVVTAVGTLTMLGVAPNLAALLRYVTGVVLHRLGWY